MPSGKCKVEMDGASSHGAQEQKAESFKKTLPLMPALNSFIV